MRQPKKAPRKLKGPKRILFRVLSLVLALTVIEAFSWIAIALVPDRAIRRTSDIFDEQSNMIRAFLARRSVPHHIEIHPVLGWRYAANFRDQDHQMNSMALRSAREYEPIPPPGVLRIAAFGDSYVYGSEVDNASAWATVMESNTPNLEVLNYGVGGYGVDQAYLRYLLEGSVLAPHVVLIGFTPDDIVRTVNVYRRFLWNRDFVLFKPRYVLGKQGELSLLDVPMRELKDYERLLANPSEVIRFGENDYWYEPSIYENPFHDYLATLRLTCAFANWLHRKYIDPERPIRGETFNETSTAFRIQVALFERFTESVRASGALPLVVMLPDEQSVWRVRQGQSTVYDPLLRRMQERRIAYIDAVEAFKGSDATAKVKGWFAPKGHYSVVGNTVVAVWLVGAVREQVTNHDSALKHVP